LGSRVPGPGSRVPGSATCRAHLRQLVADGGAVGVDVGRAGVVDGGQDVAVVVVGPAVGPTRGDDLVARLLGLGAQPVRPVVGQGVGPRERGGAVDPPIAGVAAVQRRRQGETPRLVTVRLVSRPFASSP